MLTFAKSRRAKIKLLHKKSIETGEECDAIPESMRQYLINQAMEAGKPFPREFLGPSMDMVNPYVGGAGFLGAEAANPSKVGECTVHLSEMNMSHASTVIHHFHCKSLSIGSWRRVGQNAMDLVIFYAPEKACLTYYINNDSAGYKIEFPFAYIKNITLEDGAPNEPDGMPPHPRGLVVELTQPPNFFMDSSGTGGFNQCGDFTEDQQASQIMVHHLGGHPKILYGQLAKLMSLESYQNRHMTYDHNPLAMSAPVSPHIPRPASQPNHMAHPHLAMFQENGFGMPPPGPRGHKRTRSRSVPAPIEFSMMNAPPMPSLHIQRPSTTMTDPSIFAPVPQYASHLNTLNPNLRVDTISGFGMDYRQPLSATTTGTPSEYASPALHPASQPENIPPTDINAHFNVPYLSPMAHHANLIQPSVSPLSAYSHGDPVIANQSPPLGTFHRSPSVDFLTMPQDHPSALQDEGAFLSEMYSKQNLNLPMHSPSALSPSALSASAMPDDSNMSLQLQDDSARSSEEIDFRSMVNFGTIDPSSLSPENIGI